MTTTPSGIPAGATSKTPTVPTDSDISAPWTVEKKLSKLNLHPDLKSSSPITFFHLLERLKTTKRQGWTRFGIRNGESIADHMYRMSLLTLFAPSSLASKLDIPRCTKMALVHDVAELLVGDITPPEKIPKEEKSRRESATMEFLCRKVLGNVGGGGTGEELGEVWREYEEGKTLEARFVHDVDKIELVLQMVEYERSHEGQVDLGEFEWVARKIELPEVRAWCEDVLEERRAFWKGLGKGS